MADMSWPHGLPPRWRPELEGKCCGSMHPLHQTTPIRGWGNGDREWASDSDIWHGTPGLSPAAPIATLARRWRGPQTDQALELGFRS